MKRSYLVAGGCLLPLTFFVIVGLGAWVVLEVPFALAVGWLRFLLRVVPAVRVDPSTAFTALVAAALLGAGTHAALVRFHRHWRADDATSRPWRLRWTLCLLGLFGATLACSMATIGAAHQIGWLFTGGKIIESSRDRPIRRLRLQVQRACQSYADSTGDGDERLRLWWPLRDTHHVIVDERRREVLIFPRHPDADDSRALRCMPDGKVTSEDEAAVRRWRGLREGPVDGGAARGESDAATGAVAPGAR